MDQWMPYVSLPFFTSEAGRLLFLFYAVVLVGCHMQYVHSRVDITRRFTTLELVADLVGLTWMRNLCQELYPEQRGLQVFLFVHFVVHALSLAWALVGWASLSRHMQEFRRRKGHPLFVAAEWLYEQSDTALYFVLAMGTLTRLPPPVAMGLVIAASLLAGSAPLKRWFAAPAPAPTGDEAGASVHRDDAGLTPET